MTELGPGRQRARGVGPIRDIGHSFVPPTPPPPPRPRPGVGLCSPTFSRPGPGACHRRSRLSYGGACGHRLTVAATAWFGAATARPARPNTALQGAEWAQKLLSLAVPDPATTHRPDASDSLMTKLHQVGTDLLCSQRLRGSDFCSADRRKKGENEGKKSERIEGG